MRAPTPYMEAFSWWLCALENRDATRHDGDPQCGFYKRRMVKKGPWVPVRIFLDRDIDPETGELTRDEVISIEINGIQKTNPEKHWAYLTPVSQSEYDRLTDGALRMTDPNSPINLADMPTLPF